MVMLRTPTLVVGLLLLAGVVGSAGAQDEPTKPGQPLSDAEILRRMEALNRRAATQPDAAARRTRRKELDAEYVQSLKHRNEQDWKDAQKNSRVVSQIAGIDEQLRKVRAEGVALERYRDQLLAQQQGDLSVASSAGRSEFSGVVGHKVFSGSSENPYVSLQAIRDVQDRYGQKLEPVNGRIAKLAATQQQLMDEREALRKSLYVHAQSDPEPQAANSKDANDRSQVEAEYPGVDIDSLFAAALADAARDMGIDPKALPLASTPTGKALNALANKYFNERAAAAVKVNLASEPVQEVQP